MNLEGIYRRMLLALLKDGEITLETICGRWCIRFEDINEQTGELPIRILDGHIEALLYQVWAAVLPITLAKYHTGALPPLDELPSLNQVLQPIEPPVEDGDTLLIPALQLEDAS